ncbi:MAG TPA: hypothetical protein VFG99_05440 [Chloroflexia bacterium]|nr:hypothetical protein [Chloroflexia bacterium]
MRLRGTLSVFLLVAMVALVVSGCDNGPAPATPTLPQAAITEQVEGEITVAPTRTTEADAGVGPTSTAAPGPGGVAPTEVARITPTGTIVDAVPAVTIEGPTPVDDTVPTATPVTARSSGEALTALQALAELKDKAVAEMPDARLAMLVNSRPGQQKILLGTSLGDPNVNEATPGGLGRNWTLVAVSPSQGRAVAFSTDGTVVDMTAAGTVPDELLANFGSTGSTALELSGLDLVSLTDSDTIVESVGERGAGDKVGIALLAPQGLGIGPLPTPVTGGASPQLAYELFSTDPNTQLFVFFDAVTGNVVLDSGT